MRAPDQWPKWACRRAPLSRKEALLERWRAQLPKNSDSRSMHSIGGRALCTIEQRARSNSRRARLNSRRARLNNRCSAQRSGRMWSRFGPAKSFRWKRREGPLRGVQNETAGVGPTDLKFVLRSHEMRTKLPEQRSDRRGTDAVDDQQEVARNSPSRRREPHNEREDDGRRGSETSRSRLRHGARHA